MNYLTEEFKYKKMFNFLGRWVLLNECGISVGEYLKDAGVRNVAIYGFGILGKHLLFELRQSGINIVYGIDKRSDKLNLDILFLDWEKKEDLPDVDMLIVTAIADYPMIEKEICEVREYPIVSLEDIFENMEKQRRSM